MFRGKVGKLDPLRTNDKTSSIIGNIFLFTYQYYTFIEAHAILIKKISVETTLLDL